MIKPSEEHIQELLNVQLKQKHQLKEKFFIKRRGHTKVVDLYEERKKKVKLQECKRPKFEDMICPICIDLIQKVTTTGCGHAFCEMCLFDSLIRKAECPICRIKITSHSFQYCQSFDERLQELVNSYGDQHQREQFEKRLLEKQEWDKSKKIEQLVVGQKVDIMDTSFVWCVGVIQTISKDELQIHYEGWGKEYDEYIPIDSHRIAPLGFFTNRNDIPSYQQQNNITDSQHLFQLIQLIEQYPAIINRNLGQ